VLNKLHGSEFSKIFPLLTGSRVNIEIKAIAAGNNPGWIFVDESIAPQTALIFSSGQGGFYFTGKTGNKSFEKALPQTIIKMQSPLARMGIKYFEYSGTSTEWDDRLEKLFAHKDYKKELQRVYLLRKGEAVKYPALKKPVNYRVEEVNKNLLSHPHIDTSYIKKNILDWWDSLNDYCKFGKGYCSIYDGKAVSICLTSFVAQNKEWGIGIYTDENHRERGLARAAAIELLKLCNRTGATAYWDCNDSNIPSRKLAESLGFSLSYNYWIYFFKLA